jgi:hypothetical protein
MLIAFPSAIEAQTRTCYYLVGPRAGTAQYFPNFPAIPLGAPCNDGVMSRGVGTPDGVQNPVGEFELSPLSCNDLAGHPVPYNVAAPGTIGPIGLATVQGGMPVILLDTYRLHQLPQAAQNFLLAHECGHHALGQIRGVLLGGPMGRGQEAASDCFAMGALRYVGALSSSERNVIIQFLRNLPGDPMNDPGPIRAARLDRC